MTFTIHKLIGKERPGCHGIYTNPQSFQEELQRVWRRSWLYVAHESEIPFPGDFKSLTLAHQRILVVRGEDDQVRVLFNTCRHRAVTVCHEEEGNATHFTCTYHGWVYNTKGSLIGLSGPDCSVRRFAERRGLMPVPRLDVYRGFIFASLSSEGESLDEHLGEGKFFIDLVVDQSANGIEVMSGRHRYRRKGAWKPRLENGVDGDHADDALTGEIPHGGRIAHFASTHGLAEDLGNGHMLLLFPTPPHERVITQNREELERRLGPEKTQRICETERTLFIFPNLFLVDRACTSLCIINPVAPDLTEITTMPFAPHGEPSEMTAQRLRHYEAFVGLADNDERNDLNASPPYLRKSIAEKTTLHTHR